MTTKLPTLLATALAGCLLASPAAADDAAPAGKLDYSKDVAPLLQKHCAACHNEQDREGGLSLQTFASLQQGGDSGAALVPGNPAASRLLRVLTGGEPAMPPEDSPPPTAEQVRLLARWIDEGARGPDGAEPPVTLNTPRIEPPASLVKAVTSLDWSPRGAVAVGRFGSVELRPADDSAGDRTVTLDGFPGKVFSARFSADGRTLAAASGTTGLAGWAALWDVDSGKLLREFRGHYDAIQAATLSPDGKLLATGSYDNRIILWDAEDGRRLRVLSGHNGAIYDLDFNADGSVLASASGDETVKLWRVADGLRLDTLSQPLKEQYTVRFSPDDKHVVAGGADNRIRVWQFVSRSKPRINPLAYARFAHEGAVSHIRFADQGRLLVSVAEDRTVKLWDTRDYSQAHLYPPQPDVVSAVAVAPGARQLLLGRHDGSLEQLPLATGDDAPEQTNPADAPPPVAAADFAKPAAAAEAEPNDDPGQAQEIQIPAVVRGAIDGPQGDEDLFRFTARAGQRWMIEVKAARDKSPLDSRVEVLDAEGRPVQRLILQAVRDSYFTFRGKDSDTSDDFRVHNWEEMELNQLLYCNGEVVKLWHYPRGPDSGFIVYPGYGKRHTYFGTTAMSHALHEPCYIVEPHPVGTSLIPNGLPVFPVYYENDDDPLRQWGSDSRLQFTAPADGQYLVRIADVRGQSGSDYKYQLTLRPQRPDFQVTLSGASPTVNAGSGKEFTVEAKRIDGFDGEIEVQVENLPPGFHCPSPIVIESGQLQARGLVMADADAAAPTDEQSQAVQVTARAAIDGQPVERPVNSLGTLKLGPQPKIVIRVRHSGQQQDEPQSPVELTIAPGETITAEVVAERHGYNGRISLGKHDAGRNMPHGVFVDNIGLNGLMILNGQTRREFFITAAPWVPEQTRVFFLRSSEEGSQTTQPVLLHVRGRQDGGR